MKNRFLSFLLSLLAATGLWLYVVTVVSPGAEATYYDIPVTLQGANILTERGLMITSGGNQTVSLTMAGNRSDLNKLNRGNITLIADLTRIDAAGEQTLEYTYSLPGDMPNNAATVQSWNPKYITITVENRVSRDIPVSVRYTGSVPTDFIADKENAVLDFPTVNATGPESVMEKISKAVIDVDLTGRNESFSESFRYTLCDENGDPVDVAMITTNVPEIRLEMRVQRVKELPLTVTVVDGGGATLQTSKITVEPQSIRISGNDALLERMEDYNLGTINLAEIAKDTDLAYQIALPEGVTNLSGVTDVTVSVRFPDLLTKEFAVKNITMENVPEGLQAEILAQAVTVTVRGNKDEVSAMTDRDITITVNFTDSVEGTSTFRANVVIGEKFPNVGCLGTYSVSATLSKAEETKAAAGENG